MANQNLDYAVVPVTAYQQNSCIIYDSVSKEGVVTDPGGDVDRLQQKLDELGVTVKAILITHGHLDHCGATAKCKARWSVPVYGPHKGDWFWIKSLPVQSKMMGLPGGKSFKPDRWLVDGDVVEVAGLKFDVVHCPGHTPGHVVFVAKESSLAWVGDVLFQGSVGRTDFPKSDSNALMHSICEKLLPLGDGIRFVPGHGPMSSFGEERLHNPFVKRYLSLQ